MLINSCIAAPACTSDNRADDDAVVVFIPHNFHLVLFPTQQRLIDEQLMVVGELESAGTDLLELLLVVRHAAAGAAHKNLRLALVRLFDDLSCCALRFFQLIRSVGLC